MAPNDGLAPTACKRRSFIYRELVRLGAAFAEVDGCAAPVTCGASAAEETAAARRLGLCDVSAAARAGYKGWRAIDWLRDQGCVIGAANNQAYAQDDGTLIARLADSELLILAPPHRQGGRIRRLAQAWASSRPEGCYPVLRADANAAFLITGARAAPMLAKLCAVDLRPRAFPDLAVAQTSVARLNAVIVRTGLGPIEALHLLFDSASADYLFACLVDAMAEFDGRVIGLAALVGNSRQSRD